MQIEFKHLSHTYPGRPARVALQALDLRVPSGQFCAILGPSGCGKSTLLRLAAGLLRPSAGEILVNGLPPETVARQRNIAWLAQSPALLPWLTARANAALAGRYLPAGRSGQCSPEEALAKVGLGDVQDAYPHQLSGGMQQRLALARLLCMGARVWLMDEPFAALDILTRERLAGELVSLWQPLRPSVLWVTHHVEEAVHLADRVVVLGLGVPAPAGAAAPGNGHFNPSSQVRLDLALDLPRPRRALDPAFQDAAQRLRAALGVFGEAAVAA